MPLQHSLWICSLLIRADVTVSWLLAQLGFVDQIPISSQIKEVDGRFESTY